MILLIDICKEPLHRYEFVNPIEDILKKNNFKYTTKHYLNVSMNDISKADKIIICGTSLKDNDFINNLDTFSWIKSYKKPILGICGGSHIIGLVLGKKIRKNKEIGFKRIKIEKEFLGIKGEIEPYYLHQLQVLPEIFHEKNIYATLFHPEVRNQEMIINFCKIK